MNYIALARKWRPKTFSQLLGQTHLTNALINALDKNRIHHAYLFTGTRGVGKTSVARLFAKALNCEKGISSSPCLKCDCCIAFDEGRFIDLIEIDGASKTKVEDTREIIENIQYAPNHGRYKVYLIDEVHMLSQHSFNALLKTLEEPPEHVIFLLATTESHKLPITVLSRCLQFNLKHISTDVITNHLENILKEESIIYESAALALISKAAKGSMRDALSLLDQAIIGCKNELTYVEVQDLLGVTQEDYALQILLAISTNTPDKLTKISHQINISGGLFNYVLNEMLNYLHQVALSHAIAEQKLDENIGILKANIGPEDAQLLYQIALKGAEDIQLAPTMLVGFEMTILRMHAFVPINTQVMPNVDIHTSENKTVGINSSQSNTQEVQIIEQTQASGVSVTKDKETPASLDAILPHLNIKGLSLNAVQNSEMVSFANNVILLRADVAHKSLFTSNVLKQLESAFTKYYKKEITVKLEFGEVSTATPAEIQKQTQSKNLDSAYEALQNDLFFKQLQDEFAAELVKNSIASLKD